ncbi:MAG: hypothetical protein L6R19_19485 [Alphaproteobacteria bacterium]|nr:hypothetical protein [Alphaproteobacteria bacterium]
MFDFSSITFLPRLTAEGWANYIPSLAVFPSYLLAWLWKALELLQPAGITIAAVGGLLCLLCIASGEITIHNARLGPPKSWKGKIVLFVAGMSVAAAGLAVAGYRNTISVSGRIVTINPDVSDTKIRLIPKSAIHEVQVEPVGIFEITPSMNISPGLYHVEVTIGGDSSSATIDLSDLSSADIVTIIEGRRGHLLHSRRAALLEFLNQVYQAPGWEQDVVAITYLARASTDASIYAAMKVDVAKINGREFPSQSRLAAFALAERMTRNCADNGVDPATRDKVFSAMKQMISDENHLNPFTRIRAEAGLYCSSIGARKETQKKLFRYVKGDLAPLDFGNLDKETKSRVSQTAAYHLLLADMKYDCVFEKLVPALGADDPFVQRLVAQLLEEKVPEFRSVGSSRVSARAWSNWWSNSGRTKFPPCPTVQ